MDRRRWMTIGAGALAAGAFVALGLWGASEHAGRSFAEAAMTGQYQRAFYSTVDNVQNVHVLLGKASVAGGRSQLTDIFSRIQGQATAAQENLTQLPVTEQVASRTAKFLTQVGDFAGTMLARTAAGQAPDAAQRKTLASLYSQAGDLNRQLRAAEGKTGPGRLYWSNLAAKARGQLGWLGKGPRGGELAGIDTQMQKYPGLIYDGPFSDAPARGGATLTGPPTPAGRVGGIAGNFVDRLGGVQYRSKFTGSVKGALPAWRVQVSPVRAGADGITTVDVTAVGSHVAWFLDDRPVKSASWTVAKAADKAVAFLQGRGLTGFVPAYHRVAGNQVVFNLVRDEGGLRNYLKQVKVAVARDNGQVVGFEGTGYLLSSGVRAPGNKVVLNGSQAARLVAGAVPGSGRLCLIPDGRGGSLYAYEFGVRQGDSRYLVYVDAASGKEVKILQEADTPGGRLVI